MGIAIIIIITLIVMGLGVSLYRAFRFPHDTYVTYLTNWQYRMLRKIRSAYKWGQQQTPPDGHAFFVNQARVLLAEALSTHKPLIDSYASRLRQAEDIVEMLQKEDFVKHYFTEYESFSGSVFYIMYEDYRTGDYLKKDYSIEEQLKKILPPEIVSNDGAFIDFMKFVYAGWFDKDGHYVLTGRTKHHIGRAIKEICWRHHIVAPARIFAPFWGEERETVEDWMKKRSRDPHLTEQYDKVIREILK